MDPSHSQYIVGAARAAKEIMKLDFGWDEVESLQVVQFSILDSTIASNTQYCKAIMHSISS